MHSQRLGEGGVNKTVYPNKKSMAASTNMVTYTYMAANVMSILMKSSALKYPQSDQVLQENSSSLLSNISVNSKDDNNLLYLLILMLSLMRIILPVQILIVREVEDNYYYNEHATG